MGGHVHANGELNGTSAVMAPPTNRELREQVSNLQGLLLLSMLMTESNDEQKIMRLAGTSVPSFGRSRTVGVYLLDGGWQTNISPCPGVDVRVALETQMRELDRGGGILAMPSDGRAHALPLKCREGHIGFLVAAGEEPSRAELFLLKVLSQQTGVALANARLHTRERETAEELRSVIAT